MTKRTNGLDICGKRTVAAALIVWCGLVLVACSGGSDEQSTTNTATVATVPSDAGSSMPTTSATNAPTTDTPDESDEPNSKPSTTSTTAASVDLPFYGMQYVPTADLDVVAGLGINTLLQDFPADEPDTWLAMLDEAHARDMKMVAWQWPPGWDWDEGSETWSVTPNGRLFLETVADHPALLAVYGTHEPYWNECFGCGWETADLQDLYRKIKAIRDVPVYTAFDGFEFWVDYSPETTFAPGICDYCDTWFYPVTDDGYDYGEYVRRLETELAVFRELDPDAKFVWVVQAFESELSNRVMPNADELREMVDIALDAEIDGLWWYTWTFDPNQYEDVLANHPELHPVVRDAYDDFLAESESGG